MPFQFVLHKTHTFTLHRIGNDYSRPFILVSECSERILYLTVVVSINLNGIPFEIIKLAFQRSQVINISDIA